MTPIYNFDILQLDGPYSHKFSQIFCMEKNQWSSQFNDWSKMDLKYGMDQDKDYYLVTHQNWLRLLNLYGGGPEIIFHQYYEERVGEDLKVQKIARHDLDPIKVEIHTMGRANKSFIFEHEHTILMSRHCNQVLMKQAFIEARPDIGQNNFKMFVVFPDPSATKLDLV